MAVAWRHRMLLAVAAGACLVLAAATPARDAPRAGLVSAVGIGVPEAEPEPQPGNQALAGPPARSRGAACGTSPPHPRFSLSGQRDAAPAARSMPGATRVAPSMRSMAGAGEWQELVDLLIASLALTRALVTVPERDEIRSLLEAMDMPDEPLAELNIEG